MKKLLSIAFSVFLGFSLCTMAYAKEVTLTNEGIAANTENAASVETTVDDGTAANDTTTDERTPNDETTVDDGTAVNDTTTDENTPTDETVVDDGTATDETVTDEPATDTEEPTVYGTVTIDETHPEKEDITQNDTGKDSEAVLYKSNDIPKTGSQGGEMAMFALLSAGVTAAFAYSKKKI